MEKLKTLGKHILIAFCGVVIFTGIGYGLQVVNSYFSGMSNYVNSQSFTIPLSIDSGLYPPKLFTTTSLSSIQPTKNVMICRYK